MTKSLKRVKSALAEAGVDSEILDLAEGTGRHKRPPLQLVVRSIRSFFDPTLVKFSVVWAAAGTPNHIFKIDPATLLEITDATLADFI